DLAAKVFRHAGIVADEIQQPFCIVFVFFYDLFAGGVIAIGVGVVHADHIGGEGAVVVDVGLVIGHGVDLEDGVEVFDGVGGEEAEEELVVGGVVMSGAGD